MAIVVLFTALSLLAVVEGGNHAIVSEWLPEGGSVQNQTFSFDVTMTKLMFAYAASCPQAKIEAWTCYWCKRPEAHSVNWTHSFTGEYGSIYGFAGVSEGYIVFSFRGTKLASILNYLSDIWFWAQPPFEDAIPGARVHGGFLAAYMSLRSQVVDAGLELSKKYPKLAFAVVGHSLGGAIATLAAADLAIAREVKNPVELWTFGSPRVGNKIFADYLDEHYLDQSFRITNNRDPIPRLPPYFFGVEHVDTEYWFSSATKWQKCKTEDPACNRGRLFVNLFDHGTYLGVNYLDALIHGCGL